MKQYTSFEEIDRDLKILKLQAQIDKEEIKLTIEEVKDSLSPLRIVGNTIGAIMQKAIVLKAVAKMFGIKRV
ncbi:MAG: hypothetical protein CMP12_02500 [Zunongwangia sp.]|jgi:hypothetical protein|uniref:Glutaminyl-tRNA synthetase n=2 Tax=Zunongwangia profunda TaxID=398743 RepID=D5BBF5_ZUNPS|nr:DUF6327 family protein [Zunongwangia profunda]MAC63259.1 hypothetical protein [Flavobacteriaceae bacterium]MAO34776.1 hypothetical protein [Zunongwangia sp.]ADF50389.1 glutaminyl-tRNA synthetase [Zunongwangia profunda SM-A87]MAS70697.1 hypothetical protein [Zunongwangia sp.]HCV79752.1 hypothetical protein [Zunongwangia profunda]|tara:strand:- start:1725 stop:1940 length:216 start_codon:yes stop_codon:yes gene_type:complete